MYSGYLVPSKLMAFATSVGSVIGCACAAIERPVIAIGLETSWSIVNDTRLSRAVRRLLALRAAQEIERQAVVHIPDRRCLRPAVRPIRIWAKQPMSLESVRAFLQANAGWLRG